MLKKIEIMIMIMISYNILQKRLIFQKYKKCPPGKYAMLLYVAGPCIRWISIRFDADLIDVKDIQEKCCKQF